MQASNSTWIERAKALLPVTVFDDMMGFINEVGLHGLTVHYMLQTNTREWAIVRNADGDTIGGSPLKYSIYIDHGTVKYFGNGGIAYAYEILRSYLARTEPSKVPVDDIDLLNSFKTAAIQRK